MALIEIAIRSWPTPVPSKEVNPTLGKVGRGPSPAGQDGRGGQPHLREGLGRPSGSTLRRHQLARVLFIHLIVPVLIPVTWLVATLPITLGIGFSVYQTTPTAHQTADCKGPKATSIRVTVGDEFMWLTPDYGYLSTHVAYEQKKQSKQNQPNCTRHMG